MVRDWLLVLLLSLLSFASFYLFNVDSDLEKKAGIVFFGIVCPLLRPGESVVAVLFSICFALSIRALL